MLVARCKRTSYSVGELDPRIVGTEELLESVERLWHLGAALIRAQTPALCSGRCALAVGVEPTATAANAIS